MCDLWPKVGIEAGFSPSTSVYSFQRYSINTANSYITDANYTQQMTASINNTQKSAVLYNSTGKRYRGKARALSNKHHWQLRAFRLHCSTGCHTELNHLP
jgi:hypothetical protein